MASRYVVDVIESVGIWYGEALTGPQAIAADTLLPLAEATIDDATGTTFGAAPVAAERHPVRSDTIWLYRKPVASVEVVRAYAADWVTATVLSDAPYGGYQLTNPLQGRLWLPGAYGYGWVEVDYTPSAVIPVAISAATAALVAYWLRSQSAVVASTGGASISSSSVGDVSISFQRDPAQADVATGSRDLPPTVRRLLAPWLGRVTIA